MCLMLQEGRKEERLCQLPPASTQAASPPAKEVIEEISDLRQLAWIVFICHWMRPVFDLKEEPQIKNSLCALILSGLMQFSQLSVAAFPQLSPSV